MKRFPMFKQGEGQGSLADEISSVLGKLSVKREEKEDEEAAALEAGGEEEVVEVPEAPPKKEEEPPKEPEEGTVDWYKKQMDEAKEREATLLENINNLSRGGQILGIEGDIKMPEQPPSKEPEPKVGEQEPGGFSLKREEVEEAMEDPDKMTALLTKVYNAGYETSMRATTKIVPSVITRQLEAQRVVETFLKNNPDLAPVESYVGQIANEILSKDPNKKPADVLKEAGDEARKRLRIKGFTPAAEIGRAHV